MSGSEYPKGSEIGPVQVLRNTKSFVAAWIKYGNRAVWVNIWCRYNRDDQPRGARYCDYMETGEKYVPNPVRPAHGPKGTPLNRTTGSPLEATGGTEEFRRKTSAV